VRRRAVLIAAQDATLRATVARVVRAAGYAVELADGIRRARQIATGGKIDLAIVAPDEFGSAGADLVREVRNAIGRLVLVGERGTDADRLSELIPGGRLRLSDPLDEQELLDRIAEAMATQAGSGGGAAPASELLRFGDLTLDNDGRALLDAEGREVALTHAEFSALLTFARSPGRVLSREHLRNAVFGEELEAYDRSIDMLVSRLRRKIESDPRNPRFIVTVPGAGYKFAIRVQRAEASAKPRSLGLTPVPGPRPPQLPERRQLTVLWSRVGDLAAIASEQDTETVRETMENLRRVCAEIVARHGGFVPSFFGNNLIAYFGWPEAHEDAAGQAVRAGLALVNAVAKLTAPERLHARVGIATGLVVVGDLLGSGSAQQHEVLGEAPNLASRLQAFADPDMVVLSDGTRRLVGTAFDLESVGSRKLKERGSPIKAWRVSGENRSAVRFAGEHCDAPLIGRHAELQRLHAAWENATHGWGQTVVLSGEAGIGKSRMVAEFSAALAAAGHQLLTFQCLPSHVNDALHPVVRQMEAAAGFSAGDTPERRLERLRALLSWSGDVSGDDLVIFAGVMAIPADEGHQSPASESLYRKARIFGILLHHLAGLADNAPLLLLLEDAHWIDPTTLELFERLIGEFGARRMLLIVTCRPDFVPFGNATADVTPIALSRLSIAESGAMIQQVAGGRELPKPVFDEILAKTDGIPLFIEELTKNVLESRIPVEATDGRDPRGAAGPPNIPATLHDSLMVRLDRMGWAKELAQAASALGRDFQHAVIAAATEFSPERLREGLQWLTDAQLVYRRGAGEAATYTFRHALLQDAAYASLPGSRRRALHHRIADVLETMFPEIAKTQPEVIARHLTEAQLIERAIPWWRRAGQRNAHASANIEAVAHFESCLPLLAALPDGGQRDSMELDVRIDLGAALSGVSGYTSESWKINSARLLELSERIDDPSKLFPALWGQWVETFSSGEMGGATAMAERLLQVAQRHDQRAYLMVGNRVLGMSLVGRGDIAPARSRLRRAISLYDSEQDVRLAYVYAVDQRLSALSYLCIALLQLGDVEQATSLLDQASADAIRLDQANTTCFVLSLAACFHLLRRDFGKLQRCANDLERIAVEHSQFGRALLAQTINRLIEAQTGGTDLLFLDITQRISQLKAINWGFWVPWLLLLNAEVFYGAGRQDQARLLLDEVDLFVQPRSYGLCIPELHRLRARFAALDGEREELVEAHYQRSISAAHRQFAQLPYLRAVTDLACYWRDRGRFGRANALLAGALNGIGKDFCTEELIRSRDLLATWS
jgi:predicted ATPase/DNA-binding response OmpR family regulator/class 3 adenylate cyclase